MRILIVIIGGGDVTHQPQGLSCGDLDSEEDLVVGDIQEDLTLRYQDITATIGVWTK